jgi:arylsulfatase A-like enzyme
MRVPLIVRYPRAAQGASAEGVVELLDLFPTFCEAAGLPVPKTLDGKSFLPLIRDPKAGGKAGAFCQFGNGRTVRTLQWRLIERNDGSNELYDHRNDPLEYHNVASNPEHGPALEELHSLLDAELGPRPAPNNRPGFPEFKKKQKQQLSPP